MPRARAELTAAPRLAASRATLNPSNRTRTRSAAPRPPMAAPPRLKNTCAKKRNGRISQNLCAILEKWRGGRTTHAIIGHMRI